MMLKEELEILRGEPIEVFTGDPMDIPCIETSDPEKLCKHPVVSVQMITYNHEPYIRQAIEGVMMQKTDFEFELIIGEDCSRDRTREICFEYQKRHPDKIRVLWWHENVSKHGGNGRRCRARCRGEFIALCEGDDYWTDPYKLQKQVDLLRKHATATFCFCGSKVLEQETGEVIVWNSNGNRQSRLIRGKEFFDHHLFGGRGCGGFGFLMTATVMFRREATRRLEAEYEVFSWRMHLGDTTLWLGLSSLGDVYYLADDVSVYRRHGGGVCHKQPMGVLIDALIVRIYWARKIESTRSLVVKFHELYDDRFYCMLESRDIRCAARKLLLAQRVFSQLVDERKNWVVKLLVFPFVPCALVKWMVLCKRRLFG